MKMKQFSEYIHSFVLKRFRQNSCDHIELHKYFRVLFFIMTSFVSEKYVMQINWLHIHCAAS